MRDPPEIVVTYLIDVAPFVSIVIVISLTTKCVHEITLAYRR